MGGYCSLRLLRLLHLIDEEKRGFTTERAGKGRRLLQFGTGQGERDTRTGVIRGYGRWALVVTVISRRRAAQSFVIAR